MEHPIGARRSAGEGGWSFEAVRAPLFALRGASELLLTGAAGPLPASARELVLAVAEATSRLERLVPLLLQAAVAVRARPGRLRALALAPALAAAGFLVYEPLAAPRIRAAPAAFADLLSVSGALLCGARRARVQRSRRGRLVLLELQGALVPRLEPAGRALLAAFLARLAVQGGARLLAITADGVALAVRAVGADERL